ncbi:MAG: hypothetical protein ACXVPU_11060 [Bacteroidia bacterium]
MTIIFYSCGDKGINDLSKRNDNWVWFVDKTSGQGSWVPIGNSMTLQNGNYTAFYYNGKIREKGKIVETQHVDTIYFYDLNEKLIKYTILGTDSSIQFYVNDGLYKAYSPKGEIVEEGIVKNHHITAEKWYGPFEHFVQIFDAIQPAKMKFSELGKKMKETLIESTEVADSSVSAIKIKEIDSLYSDAFLLAQKSLDQLNKIESLKEMPEFKDAALGIMTSHQSLLKNEFSEIISLIKEGLKEKNRTKIYSILGDIVKKDEAENRFLKAQSDFQSKFELSEEQDIFFRQRFQSMFN